MSTVETQTEVRPEVRVSRRYPVPPEKVWRAWTEPQALSEWFGHAGALRKPVAEVDVRVGGRYRIEFEGRTGQMNVVTGVYLEVEPVRRLAFTWTWQGTPEDETRVSIELTPLDEGRGTSLQFVHNGFASVEESSGHERGWLPAFDTLALLFAPGGRLA